jgi:hypothetical protein
MVDPKDPKDTTDLNKQAPPDNKAPQPKDEIAEEDLAEVSGGGTIHGYPFPT